MWVFFVCLFERLYIHIYDCVCVGLCDYLCMFVYVECLSVFDCVSVCMFVRLGVIV